MKNTDTTALLEDNNQLINIAYPPQTGKFSAIYMLTRNITIPRGIVWRTGVLPPSLVLGTFTLDPFPCPRNHHPLIDIHLH